MRWFSKPGMVNFPVIVQTHAHSQAMRCGKSGSRFAMTAYPPKITVTKSLILPICWNKLF